MIVYELGQFRSYAVDAVSIPFQPVWDLCRTSGTGTGLSPRTSLPPVSSSLPMLHNHLHLHASAIRGTIG
jgi:hypothetical protein